MSDTFLEVEDLSVTFRPRRGSETRPLRGVSFRVQRGSVTGLIGETGCGKSLTGRAVLGVLPAGASASGVVTVGGRSVLPVPRQEPRVPARLALVPQNPGANLNPVVPIGTQLSLIAHRHHQGSRRELAGFVDAELRAVGLDDVARVRRSYPHQLSGGMQQRVAIAAALVSRPDLVVADEPTTALDVTVEQQVLQVLRDRQQALGLTVLLITHDMGVVSKTCDHVCVLYAGRVVEDGPTAAVLEHPMHPYTARLLAARPAGTPRATALTTIPGSVPNDLRNVVGCAFAPRCPRAEPDCTAGVVDLVERGPQHHAECLHPLVETT